VGLVERAGQLGTLVDQLGQVNGAGRLVLISGEAGAGKSALVDAFCAQHLTGHRVLVGRCDDLFAPRPLGPLADIARLAPGRLGAALASGDQGAVFDAFLAELAGSQPPVVVILEDLQWADEATLDLLRFVARRLDALPCLVLATHRDDLSADHPLRRAYGSFVGPRITRLHLPPLSVEAVRALVGDRPIDPVTLHARTGGNPFFVTEALAGGGSLPDTVRDAILSRAALLSGAARDALDAAAVLGRQVTPDLLCAVGDCSTGDIDECLAAGLLVDDAGRQTFRHDLARDAVESAMTPLRRRQLHTRALDALGDDGDLVHRAHHAIGSGDGAAIIELATQAADHCIALGAHTQAATLYGWALQHADRVSEDERVRLLEARARTCERVEMIAEAVVAGEALLALRRDRGDDAPLGDWEVWMGCLLRAVGRVDDAWTLLHQATARLERLGDSEPLTRALGRLGGHHMVSGEYAKAIRFCERSRAMAERLGLEQPAVYALQVQGSSLACSGDTEAGLALLGEALARAKAAGLALDVSLTCANMANVCGGTGDYRRALALLDDGIAVAEEHELRVRRNCSLVERATVLTALGRWDDAMLDVAAVLAQPGLSQTNEGLARYHLGRLRTLRGDPGGRAALETALEMALTSEEAQLIVPARLGLAEAAWLAGDSADLVAQVAACDEHVPFLDHWTLSQLAIWGHRAGRTWPSELPLRSPAAEMLAGDVRFVAAYWDERSCPYFAADALGDSDDLDDLREAHARLVALGARPRAQMVVRRLRDLGAREVPRGPRATTRANAAGLTSRELEVARFLAAGLTNAGIAERLVVSPKTIDHHVSAVLTKLGVRSRREVAEAAVAHGIDLQDGVVGAST